MSDIAKLGGNIAIGRAISSLIRGLGATGIPQHIASTLFSQLLESALTGIFNGEATPDSPLEAFDNEEISTPSILTIPADAIAVRLVSTFSSQLFSRRDGIANGFPDSYDLGGVSFGTESGQSEEIKLQWKNQFMILPAKPGAISILIWINPSIDCDVIWYRFEE